MSSTDTRIALLKEAMNIESERAALQAKIDQLQARLGQIQAAIFTGGTPAPVVAPAAAAPVVERRRPGRPKRSSVSVAPAAEVSGAPKKRGQLSKEILGALKAAGGKGVSVADMSRRFRISSRNIFVWFSTTGKNFKGITKVEPGVYAMKD